MSLINQVLRDLDTREPLQDKPASVSTTVTPPPSKASPDWVRILVWMVTGLLVLAFLAYSFLQQNDQPETVLVQPVAVNSNIPANEEVAQPIETPAVSEVVMESTDTTTPMAADKEDAVAEKMVVQETSPDTNPVDVKSEPAQQPGQPKTEVVQDVVYLPLHDDGESIQVEEVRPKQRSQAEIVVTRTTRPPIDIARQMIAEGRLTEAEAKLRELLEDKPANINARELLIGLLLRNNRTEAAAEQIQLGLKHDPKRENLVLLQARTLLDEEKVDDAVSVLENQIRIKKAGAKTLAMLAPLYQQKSMYEASASLYKQLIKYQPDKASYWVGLAVNLEALAKPSEAVDAYKRALRSDGLSVSLQQYAMQRINHFRQ